MRARQVSGLFETRWVFVERSWNAGLDRNELGPRIAAENFITTNGAITEDLSPDRPPPKITEGAAYQFFEQLDQFLKTHPDYYLDVFAHSMGAIVMNEAYRSFPNLRVRKLVYMAAACSIRDFLVGPSKQLQNNHTEFYNLCLHPRRELDEVEGDGIPARGNLLTWIDEFFEAPASFGDRTLGSLQNVVIAYRLLPQTSQIHIKAFGIARKDDPKGFSAGPQKHGDFGNFPFWKQAYWSTEVPLDQCYQILP
jgi:pimeloyl-ACP methyl ester carboxylesterase